MRGLDPTELSEDGDYLLAVANGEVTEVKHLPGRHVVEFRGEDGYSFEHPGECRRKGSLHDCLLWVAFQKHARANPDSFEMLEGRYYIEATGGKEPGFQLEAIDG